MNIKDIDTSSLRYDPADKKALKQLRIDHKDVFTTEMYVDQDLVKHDDEILRYIILVYDINSPLRKTLKTHNEVKVQAMLLAGFDVKDKRLINNVQSALLYGKDEGVAKMIVRYVTIFNNMDYTELIGMLELNEKVMRTILSDKTTKDTRKELSDTSARIKELVENVFGGKETREIEEQLYEQLAISRVSLRPEMIVRQLAAGDDVFLKDKYNIKGTKGKTKRKKQFGDA
jgi:hypothetical protein